MLADHTGTHLDDEALVLRALEGAAGEGADAERHLAGCARCRSELARLERVVRAGRFDEPGPAVEPPPGAWAAIAAQTGVAAQPVASGPLAGGHPAGAVPLRRRPERRSRRLVELVAAAAVVAVAAGGGWWAARSTAPDTSPGTGPGTEAGSVVATGRLAPLDGSPAGAASATGEVQVTDDAGAPRLVVTVDGLAPTGSTYHEVWLLERDGDGLLSLGVLDGSGGTFTVPPGTDLSRFAVVDLSAEPLDGDPGHSSDSLLRGDLELRT